MNRSYILSRPQQRIVDVERIAPESNFSIGGYVKIHGKIDAYRLSKAIDLYIEETPQLRVYLELQGESVVQKIEGRVQPTPVISCLSRNFSEREFFQKKIETKFDIWNSRLYEFAVIDTGEAVYYLIRLHHSIADGWSVNLLTRRVQQIYTQLTDQSWRPNAPKDGITDLLEIEQEYLSSEKFVVDDDYWEKKYRDFSFRHLPVAKSLEARRNEFSLDAQTSKNIRGFCSQHGISSEVFFLTLFWIVLSRRYDFQEISMGIPRLNRSRKSLSSFGMFVNVVPHIFKRSRTTFLALFHEIKQELLESKIHQSYPFEVLYRKLGLREKHFENLYQFCFNYYAGSHAQEFYGYEAENVEVYNNWQDYKLSFGVKEWLGDESFGIFIDAHVDPDSRSFSDLIPGMISGLVADVLSNAGQTVSWHSEHDLRPVRIGNMRPINDINIDDLLIASLERSPFALAVVDGDREMTYEAFDSCVEYVAQKLEEGQVGPADAVAIYANHSLEFIVFFYACLRVGACVVPIDITTPGPRVTQILEASKVSLLLTNFDDVRDLAPGISLVVIPRVDIFPAVERANRPVSKGDRPIYVIFTSGSTGLPKGVQVNSRSLVNYLMHCREVYVGAEPPVMPLFTSLSFDLTLTSLFLPLCSGGCIHVYDPSKLSFPLEEIFADDRCNIVKVTPAHLTQLEGRDFRIPELLASLIVGGELFRAGVASKFLSRFNGTVNIFNEYGPTEATIGCMFYNYTEERRTYGHSVPLGQAIQNSRIYLLDENLRPVAPLEKGQIYIAGECLSVGYLGGKEFNLERFVVDPLYPGERMYKTGDYALLDFDGNLEYAGRIDRQVKVRGFRVEIDEVEKAIAALQGVKQAAVTAKQGRNDSIELIAFVTTESGSFDEFVLRRSLASRLPSFMLPSHFRFITAMPLNANGKIDYTKLMTDSAGISNAEPETEQRTAADNAVIDGLKAILKLDTIHVEGSFYAYGGDSMKAIQLANYLRNRGVELKVRDILSFPRVSNLCQLAKKMEQTSGNFINDNGRYVPSPVVRWFHDQAVENRDSVCQSVLLRMRSELRHDELASKIQRYFNLNPVFRLQYRDDLAPPAYVIMEAGRNGIVNFCNQALDFRAIIEDASAFSQSGALELSLRYGRLVQLKLYVDLDGVYHLAVVAHHICVDAVSWYNICSEIEQYLEDDSAALATIVKNYNLYVHWLKHITQFPVPPSGDRKIFLDRTASEIASYLANGSGLHAIASHAPSQIRHIKLQLDRERTELFLTASKNTYGMRPNELLLLIAAYTNTDLTGLPQSLIELEDHGRDIGRDKYDVGQSIAWLTHLYPLLLPVSGDIHSDARTIKDLYRRAKQFYQNNGHFYTLMGGQVLQGRLLCRFNYLGDIDAEAGDDRAVKIERLLSLTDVDQLRTGSSLIEVVAFIQSKRLNITFSAGDFLGQRKSVDAYAETFERKLESITDFFSGSVRDTVTISDFEHVSLSASDLSELFDE